MHKVQAKNLRFTFINVLAIILTIVILGTLSLPFYRGYLLHAKTIQVVNSLNKYVQYPEPVAAHKQSYNIPYKIHLIWLGGSMPTEYLDNLRNMTLLCNKMNPAFTVNIWTDQGSRNANGDFFQQIAGLKIRHIESELLNPLLSTDTTYTAKEKSSFMQWVLFENLPPQNYGALSDLFRVEILRREGGLYLDTDAIIITKKFNIYLQSLFDKVAVNGGFSCLKNRRKTNNNIIIASDDPAIANLLKTLSQSMIFSMTTEYLNSMPNFFINRENYLIAKKSPVLVHTKQNFNKTQKDFMQALTVNNMPAIRILTMAAGPYKLERLAHQYLQDPNNAPGLREMEKMFDCYRNDNTWFDKAPKTDAEKAQIISKVNAEVSFYLEHIYNKDLQVLIVNMQNNFMDKFPTLNIRESLYGNTLPNMS